MSFLSDADYRDFLEQRIRTLDDATAREHVRARFESWREQYRNHRLVERAAELLASETQRPTALYLGSPEDVRALGVLAQQHRFNARLFRGFLVADGLRDSLQPEWLSPFPLWRVSEWQDREDTTVLTLSNGRPLRNNGRDRGNDYLDCFIDESRLSLADEVRRRLAGRHTVLYVDYRKVQTLAALSDEIRKHSDFATILLANAAEGSCGQEYDVVVEQPFYYLWPLVFRAVAPDLFHINVGWGTQGLPFAPFVPQEAIVDFYDLLTFVRDESLDGHHSEPLALTRASEKTLLGRFTHFVHRCSEGTSKPIADMYPGRKIVSVTEYLRDPVYDPQPASRDGTLKLVYGGLLVREDAGPDDPHYKNFVQMVKYYCGGNLHLYLYPSPYLYGFGPAKGVEELVQQMGLKNVHPCMPLAENDFVREISRYDFGLCIPTPEEVRPTSYGYILPGKIIAYLRAGLPIVVPEDQTFVADLVRDHEIGVVYGYEDFERMPELLNRQDIDRLKKNVVRFREQFRIERAAEKIVRLYNDALDRKEAVPAVSTNPAVCDGREERTPASTWSALLNKLDRSGFLGAEEYNNLLNDEMGKALSGKPLQYVVEKFRGWFEVYRGFRCCERLIELIADLKGSGYWLYLEDQADLTLLGRLQQGLNETGAARPAGFIAGPGLEQLKSRLAPYSVLSVGDPVPEGHTVISLSGGQFPAGDCRVVVNDYLKRFIDSRRFQEVWQALRSQVGRQTVLYPLYREIHTVPVMARFARQRDERLHSVCLCPGTPLDNHFDMVLTEPFFYLWPLIFRMVDPALVHLNVGWGIQALPLSPFVPDRHRTLIDFYEVLSFLPDTYFEKTRSTAEQVRFAEEHFVRNYDHVMHLCSDEVSTKLAEKYDRHGAIVSVTEYLENPVYDSPARDDGEIRLVYGGCMLATTNPDDLYYRAFMKVVPHYTRGNLRLYVYNSPYVHGIVENKGLKEVIRQLGLTNVRVCTPKKLDEFVREISAYDFGVTLLRPKDMEAVEYNYFMATKVLAYLRAGLPVVIDADNRYMAGLIERYNIGVVLRDADLERIPEILNGVDLPALKRNVAKFREEFSIEKGGEKVLKMYHEILRNDKDRPHGETRNVAASSAASRVLARVDFQGMIDVMARKENRLYYRDQSARTMASLAGLAQQFDPSIIVELGTLGGLSLRTWIAATRKARIYAVDLSFQTLRETQEFLPVDLSRVTLLEQDILKTDFSRLWTPQDKVIFFVDAHDLPNVPIMTHVLTTVASSLPDGSVVVIDDLWFSEERLTPANARAFLEGVVVNEIDELQCFHAHFAPYHEGGSFMGFAEVIPLLRFVNEHGIPLIHDRGGKHAFFVWKKAYLKQRRTIAESPSDSDEAYGSVQYNPLESVPVCGLHGETMRDLAALYRQRKIQEVVDALSQALSRDPHDEGLSYGLAVCLARAGMLSEARGVLVRNLNASSHPRYRRLFDDLSRRAESPRSQPTSMPRCSPQTGGITLFAMPKAFTGHTATIQKNAIRSWAKLDPTPEIILFGDEPGIREMAREVGAKHVAQVERNEFGTPLVDKLFEAAQDHASHGVLAYVNADMILMQDFVAGAQAVQSSLANFLVIGRRWDLVMLDEIDFSASQWRESLSNRVREDATLHAESGLDYFIFRRGLWPKIPPFAIGRTAWDNWLVIDPRRRGVPVVDGTEFITAVHQEHDYGHVRGGRQTAWNGEEAARNKSLAGPVDESAYTTGATWALSREGRLARTQLRPAQVGTATFRSRRIAWLARQAGLLTARREMTLAACMWEEALALMDKLMPSHGPMDALPRFSQDSPMTRSYATACVSLAGCYEELGELRQAAATCTKLLEMPRIELPGAQRDDIARRRDALLERTPRQAVLPESPSVDRDGPSMLSCERCKRIALIVSIPERPEGLRGVIRDIEGQVDEIRILLNEFETVPQDLYGCKKVSWVATNRTGDRFASGAWTLLRPDDEGYVVVLDDDIEYPPDYVERMIGVVEERQRRAVAVVHGIDYCEPFEDCTRDRTVYRFEVARSRDGVVDAGGVGTLVFHTSTIRPCLEDFPNPYFRDLWFAVLAARSGVPLVCVARDAHWLRPRPTEGRQLWCKFGDGNWKERKNQVFREHLLPLLDMTPGAGRERSRDFTVVCITNGRSTFEYSVRSVMESQNLQDRVEGISGMHFMDAAAKCIELSETPYFFKVDDDFFLHPAAIAYMRKKVLEHPRPEKLGMYYCHLWEDWTSRVRESIKVYNVEALKKIGGFKADQYGKVDRTTLARLQEAGYEIVADPSVVAIHACGTWQEQLEYERLWSSMAEQPYRKPTHDAMKKYCGTKSLDEQYEMRHGFLEQVNRQLDTPFQEFLAQGTPVRRDVSRIEASPRKADATVVRGPTPPLEGCRVTVFAMPKPFTGHIGTIQKNAIRSWARLDPAPEILLFGDEPGTREMAEEVGAQHIPEVGRNEFGTPLVDELFLVAQELASHEVLAYVNADIILFQDFTQAVQQVQTRLKSFLLIGQRWDLPILNEIDFQDADWRNPLLQRLRENAMLHAESGLDYFVFRRGLWPQIPPFAIGRTAWDNWLVMDPYRRGVPVVDGTEYVTAVHQDHDYGHVSGGRREIWGGEEAAKNRKLAGPADQTGLTSGATWLLRSNGELVETPPRQPQYATVEYREQRSGWLLRQARKMLEAGANELAASQCEEAIVCIDTWLRLKQEGRVPADPECSRMFAERCAAAHAVLAQCYMKMGCPERVVTTYTRLLEHPAAQLPPARRDEVVRVRDRLARQLEAMTSSADPSQVDNGNVVIDRRPKVTVITACHNSERYLKECVDSVLGQTMTSWELFLIDDGSSDGTSRLIEEYARRDARIKAFCFSDNRGPYARRNFGIVRAASDFIVIQDADDIMAPTKLEKLHRQISMDSGLAIVGSFPQTFLEEFRGLEHTETGNLPVDSDTIVASCARWQALISHGTGIIRKAFFGRIGLYDENPFAADAFWSAKLALYAETGAPVKMANVPEALTLIRIHPSSQTQMLPVFDPRSRRLRYRHYCDCKLQRIREKWRRLPSLDVAAELRNCNCSDFLVRFKAKILQWEGESLPVDFLNDLLAGAAAAFRTRSYVSCVVVLNGLEAMQRDIARRVMGFDMFRAMALHASGLVDRARVYVEREMENHDSAVARRFLQDSCEQGESMAIDRWHAEHASRLELRFGNADPVRAGVATA